MMVDHLIQAKNLLERGQTKKITDSNGWVSQSITKKLKYSSEDIFSNLDKLCAIPHGIKQQGQNNKFISNTCRLDAFLSIFHFFDIYPEYLEQPLQTNLNKEGLLFKSLELLKQKTHMKQGCYGNKACYNTAQVCIIGTEGFKVYSTSQGRYSELKSCGSQTASMRTVLVYWKMSSGLGLGFQHIGMITRKYLLVRWRAK
jgi:hypothetical protein